MDLSRSNLDTSFTARLDEFDLLEVAYVDARTLTAGVPASLAPGTYDLTVEDPKGRTGSLAEAFTITSATACPRDADSDGFVDTACPGGDDCNDSDIDIHPGANDSDYDDIDDDCDGRTDDDDRDCWPFSDCNWRIRLSFDNRGQAEDLQNFPVLVVLSSARIDYTRTWDDGGDVRFVDADGTSLLAHDIEKWEESGASFVWVSVPQIDAASDTDHMWMYYDCTVAAAQDPSRVWEYDFAGGWHHYAMIRDYTAMEVRFIVDGQPLGDVVSYANNPDGGDSSGLFVGGDQVSPSSNSLDGRIDEVRIGPVRRSDDWIAAQYLTMTDAYITFGPEENL